MTLASSATQSSAASELPRAIVQFGRLLRAAGLTCGAQEARAAVAAVSHVGLADRRRFRDALAAVLVKRCEEIEIFEQAFSLFWRAARPLPPTLEDLLAQIKSRLAGKQRARLLSERLAQHYFGPAGTARSDTEPAADVGSAGSERERLWHRDFELLTPTEFFALRRMLATLRVSWPRRHSRRTVVDRNRGPLDWRRTARALARWQLTPIRLRRRLAPVPMIVLCDVSGSMSAHSRGVLLFLHALCQTRRPIEVFVFSTRLTRITPQLRSKDADIALGLAAQTASDWEGGTRLAGCLEEFTDRWLRRVASRPSDLVLVSDGLDGGADAPERTRARLEAALAHMEGSVKHLIWVNPQFRYDGYRALALGPAVLERFADRRLSGHDLASLAELFAGDHGIRGLRR